MIDLRTRLLPVAAATLLTFGIATPASAVGLLGDTITVEGTIGALMGTESFTVDGTQELVPTGGGNVDALLISGEFIDFDDTSVSFSFDVSLGLSATFTVTGIDAELTSATGSFDAPFGTSTLTNPNTGLADFLIDGDSFIFQITAGVQTSPLTGTINLTFADDTGGPGPTPVPLPAAAWMMLTALGGMGAVRKLRKRT